MMTKVWVVIGLVAALVLPAGAARARVADPMFGAPAPGTCLTYSVDDGMLRYETSAPVDCAEGTAQVLFAGPAGTSKKTGNIEDGTTYRTCERRYDSTVGGSAHEQALSMYAMFLFSANKSQMKAGARWWRCDVTIWVNDVFNPLAKGGNFLHDGLSDFERRCLTRRGVITTCNNPHRWRSTHGVWMPGRAFPTRQQFIAFGRRRCPNGGPISWMKEYQWGPRNHYVVCYRRG